MGTRELGERALEPAGDLWSISPDARDFLGPIAWTSSAVVSVVVCSRMRRSTRTPGGWSAQPFAARGGTRPEETLERRERRVRARRAPYDSSGGEGACALLGGALPRKLVEAPGTASGHVDAGEGRRTNAPAASRRGRISRACHASRRPAARACARIGRGGARPRFAVRGAAEAPDHDASCRCGPFIRRNRPRGITRARGRTAARRNARSRSRGAAARHQAPREDGLGREAWRGRSARVGDQARADHARFAARDRHRRAVGGG